MFDDKARVGSRNSLDGYGDGFAGRGGDLNTRDRRARAAARRPGAGGREPGRARDPARPLLQGARRRRRGGRAGGRGAGLAVREPGHHLHGARLDRPAVPPGDDLRGPAERGAWRSASSRSSARSCATTPPSSASCGRAWPRCRTRRRSWPTRSRPARETLPKTIPMNEDLADVFESARGLLRGPAGARGRGAAHAAVLVAEADAALPHAGPDHLQLRHAVLPQRLQRALRGRRERHLAALHRSSRPRARLEARRPVRVANNEIGPSSGPANGPRRGQPPPLQPVPEHGVARPDARSARPATSATPSAGRTIIGNQPGNQGIKTSKTSPSVKASTPMRQVPAEASAHAFQAGLIGDRADRDRRLPRLHQGHPLHAAVRAEGRVRERAADPEGHAPCGSPAWTWARCRRWSRWAATRRA